MRLAGWVLLGLAVLAAVVFAVAAYGPPSFRARYRADVARALAAARGGPPVGEAELARLPEPVARYLRASGAAGRPIPSSIRARWRGRIRGAPAEPWMELVAYQVETFGSSPSRLFRIEARMKGLPVDAYHRFLGDEATFQVRLLSLVPVLSARGPEMTRTETVTLFNDVCMLAPGALAGPAFRWEPIDARSARGFFTRGPHDVSAVLRFDDSGMLVDFVSDDRSRSSPDGKTFTRTRWSTPLSDPRPFGPIRVPARGAAVWHPPGEPPFSYIELELLELETDVVGTGD